jgi:TonB family protein
MQSAIQLSAVSPIFAQGHELPGKFGCILLGAKVVPMFAFSERARDVRRNLALLGSVAFHGAVLWILCLGPMPIFVRPSLTAHGHHGTSTVLYFSPMGAQDTRVAEQTKHVRARLYLPVKPKAKFNAAITDQLNVEAQNSQEASPVAAGSTNSSDLYGATTGADVRPAIETTLLDPNVSRTEIPSGVEGDVIVEITIDESGSVTGTKLLKGMGVGIDEKILATVRNWHYRPATRDGIPIPSKYDAHWHFRG